MEIKKFTELYIDATKEGKKIPKEQYQKTGNYPIIDQGQQEIAGWCDDEEGSFKNVPAILFGDHTRIIKYVEEPFFIGADGVKILCPVNKKDNIKYLYYALQAARIPNLGYSRHFKVVKELNIFTYEKSIQDKIVCVLEKIDSIIMQQKRRLNYLEELVKSRFIELFGDLKINSKRWKMLGFKECAEIDTNMIHNFEEYENYPHIGIDSIEKGTGRLFGYRTIAEDGVTSGKYLFTEKHIIYSKIRPNLNKVALPKFVGLCSADAYPILVKSDICTKEYLGYTMRSDFFLDYILAFSNRTNLPKVNKKQVEGFSLPVPPLILQQQFTDFIRQTDKSKHFCEMEVA